MPSLFSSGRAFSRLIRRLGFHTGVTASVDRDHSCYWDCSGHSPGNEDFKKCRSIFYGLIER